MKKARGLGNGHPCEHYDGWETIHRNSSYTETNKDWAASLRIKEVWMRYIRDVFPEEVPESWNVIR